MPPSPQPPLRDFPDRSLRSLLENRANLREFVSDAAPGPAARFDFDRAQSLDRSFLQPDLRGRGLDLLFRIPCRGDGTDREWLVCVLIEHQSQADPLMPLRLLLYAALFWEREWKAWEDRHAHGEPLRLTPVLPIVFHTGPTPWAANRTLADMMDVPPGLTLPAPAWDVIFWDVAARPALDLSHAGPFLAALAVVRAERDDADTYRQVFAEAVRQIEPLSATNAVRWRELLRFVLEWSLRRRPSAERPALTTVAVQSHHDVAYQQEVREMNATLEVGLREVFDRGITAGQLQARRDDLRSLLEDRFGPLPEALVQQIEAIDDLSRLKAAVLQAARINSLADLQL